MPRLPRLVVPEIAHHVTQRGNRRLPVFFSDADRRAYVALIAEACAKQNTRCLAWCLMDNHIHLILVPDREDGLRATLGEAHRRYTRRVNLNNDWRGHLFEGRFASYPMDDAHLMAAVRYVENNPVAAGIVRRAEDWRWSSARAHIDGIDDGLTDVGALGRYVRNWRAMLAHGLEAADGEAEEQAAAIDAHLSSGRPRGARDWIAVLEEQTGLPLLPRKRGPKPRRVIRGQYT